MMTFRSMIENDFGTRLCTVAPCNMNFKILWKLFFLGEFCQKVQNTKSMINVLVIAWKSLQQKG